MSDPLTKKEEKEELEIDSDSKDLFLHYDFHQNFDAYYRRRRKEMRNEERLLDAMYKKSREIRARPFPLHGKN